MLNIAVVEDDEAYRAQIAGFIARFEAERGLAAKVTQFRDGGEILADYRPGFDIILLDIEMPRVNGMSAAEEIRRQDEDVVLVFVTNMAEYAVQGYSVGALDFILKPVEYDTFALKLARAVSRAKSRENAQILLTTSEGAVRLNVRQIYYVEVQNRILYYHTDQGVYKVRGTMQKAEEELELRHFVRCNYWYLVNLRHVSEIKENVAVVAGDELEISRRNRGGFLHALTNYVGGTPDAGVVRSAPPAWAGYDGISGGSRFLLASAAQGRLSSPPGALPYRRLSAERGLFYPARRPPHFGGRSCGAQRAVACGALFDPGHSEPPVRTLHPLHRSPQVRV